MIRSIQSSRSAQVKSNQVSSVRAGQVRSVRSGIRSLTPGRSGDVGSGKGGSDSKVQVGSG